MIFKQVEQVLDGTKSQTRRPVKEHEEANRWDSETDVINEVLIVDPNKSYPGNLRSKWVLGRTYAVQPSRGKKAVGRIRITKIRRERLQDISDEDCKAEGAPATVGYGMDYIPGRQTLSDDRYFTEEQRLSGYRGAFASLWDSIYPKEHNWLDNPEVWVLDFERSEE